MSEQPLETIITISKENRVFRWAIIILALALAGLAAVVVKRPPQPVWLVHESGQIMAGSQKVFSWEPLELLRRAFEVMFVPSENRAAVLPQFFTGQPLEAALAYKPDVRFTNFRIENQDLLPNGRMVVTGTVLREGKKDFRISIELVKSARTEANPFGLQISSTTVIN